MVARDYLSKGRPVYIEGSIRYEEWTDKEGQKRNTTRIRVSGPNSRLVLLGSRGDGGGPGPRARPEGAAAAGAPRPTTSRPATTTSRSSRRRQPRP